MWFIWKSTVLFYLYSIFLQFKTFIKKVYKVKSKEDSQYYAIKKSREKFKGKSDR